jgi:hypothetical protein
MHNWQARVFKPRKQRLFKHRLYGFDVETCDGNKNVYLISIFGENYQKSFYNVTDFLNELKNQRLFRNSWLFATNLHFDFFACLWQQSPELRSAFTIQFRGKTSDVMYAKTFIVNNKFCKTRERGKSGHSVMFLDTMNFDMSGVEKLGKILGLPKLDKPECVGKCKSPKDEKEWEQVRIYNLRDSEISYRYMKFLFAGFQELGATIKVTLASTAMSLFQNKFLKDVIYKMPPEILKWFFDGYYGGRTEAFGRGSLKALMEEYGTNKMYYYDFNSLYPSVMLGNEYPNPNTMRISNRDTFYYLERYEGMSDVEVICPDNMKYPLLCSRRDDGRILFPVGQWRGKYCHNELRQARLLGYKILKVHKSIYFKETMRPFDGYVNTLYAKRLEYQAAKDSREKLVKLLMNSLYGKFGQKFYGRANIVHKMTVTKEEMLAASSISELGGEYLRLGGIASEPAPFCIPIWAAYITSYARMKLHKAMLASNPVYCDTDSLMTLTQMPSSTALGDLKLEQEITDGYVVRSKFYAITDGIEGKCKIKGVALRIAYGAFKEFAENPTAKYTKFAKFKESLRRGFFPNQIIPVEKHLTLEDDKHDWGNEKFCINGWQESIPIKLYTEDEIKRAETMSKIKVEVDFSKVFKKRSSDG